MNVYYTFTIRAYWKIWSIGKKLEEDEVVCSSAKNWNGSSELNFFEAILEYFFTIIIISIILIVRKRFIYQK